MLFLLEFPCAHLLRFQQGIIEGFVFFLVHGAVEVVAARFALFLPVARGTEHDVHIQGMRPDDGRDGIIKIAVVAAHHLGQRGGEVLRSHGPGRQHHGLEAVQRGIVQGRDLPVHQRDAGRGLDTLRHGRREGLAVHGQGLARRHAVGVGQLHEVAAQFAHLGLEQADAGGQLVRAQGIGTDQLRQPVIDMGRGTELRLLFEQGHLQTGPRQTQGTFATGQAATNNRIAVFSHAISFCWPHLCPIWARKARGSRSGGGGREEGPVLLLEESGPSGGRDAFWKRLPFPRAPIPAKTFALVSAREFAGGEPPERDGPRRSCCSRSSTIPGHPGAHGAPRVAPLPVLLR